MEMRHILFAHAHNFRDLGGYPTTDGRRTIWGRLYRSDALSALTQKEWEQAKTQLGIDLVIDLRSESERDKSPILPPEGIAVRDFSLMKELDDFTQTSVSGQDASGQILESMKLDYTKTLFGNLPCAAGILDLILTHLQSGSGSIVFLCSAGKDRTGITAALLLYLCRVPEEDIIADYMVSGVYNENGINKSMESIPQELLELIPDKSVLEQSLASDPKTMRALLASFQERDICASLAGNGFSEEKQQMLRMALTEA